MPGEKGGVNEGLGEEAYGRVSERGEERRVAGKGCVAAMVSAEEMLEPDRETKLRQDSSQRVFSGK